MFNIIVDIFHLPATVYTWSMLTVNITTPSNHTRDKLHSVVHSLTCRGDAVEHWFDGDLSMEFTSQYLNNNAKLSTTMRLSLSVACTKQKMTTL